MTSFVSGSQKIGLAFGKKLAMIMVNFTGPISSIVTLVSMRLRTLLFGCIQSEELMTEIQFSIGKSMNVQTLLVNVGDHGRDIGKFPQVTLPTNLCSRVSNPLHLPNLPGPLWTS